MRDMIASDTFTGQVIPGATHRIAGYLSECYGDDRRHHRSAWRALERAKKIGGTAYANIAGKLVEVREFKGEVPDGWAEISDRYELDGIRYYLNADRSYYIKMITRNAEGRIASYMPTLAVKI